MPRMKKGRRFIGGAIRQRHDGLQIGFDWRHSTTMKLARLLWVLVAGLSTLGMGKKDSSVAVRFHVEANPRDGESFVIRAKFHNPDRDGYVGKMPVVTERDIDSVYPVLSEDGSYGCAFKLDRHGAISLETVSRENRGLTMVAIISSKAGSHQFAEMIIDKPISDGIIYVRKGLTESDIEELQRRYPTMGEKTGKRR